MNWSATDPAFFIFSPQEAASRRARSGMERSTVCRSYQHRSPLRDVSKIYTRRGDDGSTGLFGGPRVTKDTLRVAAYGEVDELNSALGVAREELRDPKQQEIADIVDRLQSELFNLGGQLATPDAAAAPKDVPRIKEED